MQPTRVIDFVDAVAVYNDYPALAGVTFSVDRQEIVLLQGPNGAGKTTLLRACAGLIPVVRGSAHVLGVDIAIDRESIRERVGLLGHQNGLFAELTIAENVDFWSTVVGATRAERDAAMQRMSIDGQTCESTSKRIICWPETTLCIGVFGGASCRDLAT